MRRVLFRWLKQVTSAIFALVALYCCAEIGLRVYDSYCGQVTRRDVYDRGLICKSWDLHHELKPLQRITQLDPDTRQPLKLATNSFGLRGTEIQVPKPPGVYRIVCLGDERTFGTHVPDGETFCSQLQTLLQARSRVKIEVINAGVPDYCPLLSCLQFKHKLLGFQPDLVILNFDMSDVADDYRYRRLATMSDNQVPLACPNPGLVMPQTSKSRSKGSAPRDALLVPQWAQQHCAWLFAHKLLPKTSTEAIAPLNKYLWLEDHPPDWSVHIQQAMSPALSLYEMAQGVYADFIVACSPAPWQVSAAACGDPQVRESAGVPVNKIFKSRTPFETLGRYFQEARIRFCDTSPQFQAATNGEQLFFNRSPCLTREGHTLYAQVLGSFLLRNVKGVWHAP